MEIGLTSGAGRRGNEEGEGRISGKGEKAAVYIRGGRRVV